MGVSLRKIAFPIMCFTFIGSFTEGKANKRVIFQIQFSFESGALKMKADGSKLKIPHCSFFFFNFRDVEKEILIIIMATILQSYGKLLLPAKGVETLVDTIEK